MKITSDVPFYYHSRDLNVGANGFAWNLSNGNANYGQDSGHNVFHQPCTVDQYFGYHREMMRHIIQNHEATFRDQVQELHRLYRRQNELMNEIRMGEIFTPHLQSQTSESNYSLSRTNCEISRTKPHAKNWILGDCSDSKLSVLTSESNQQPSAFIATYFQETVISSRKDVNDKANTSMEVLRTQHAINLELGSFKTGDSSSFNNISCRKGDFLIDLNEPIQLEELASISTCPFETHTLHNAKANSVRNSSVAIDLNSVPETEIDNEFLKMSNFIDLNTSVVIDEPLLPLSSTIVGTKFVGEVEFEEPVSPENKEGSPPRGKSEEILEPFIVELDKTAAESLIMIYSSEVEKQFKSARAELAGNFVNCLSWFAEIASSTGDDLENEITKFKSYPTDNNEGENSCIVAREKEPKGRSRNTRHHKSGLLKINGGKKCGGAKRKKCLMVLSSSSSSDFVDNNKKCKSKQGILQSWGMIKKRRGGHRRPAGKFLVAADG